MRPIMDPDRKKKKEGRGQLRSTKEGEGDRVVPLTKGGWEGDVDGPHVLGNVGLERRAGGKPDGAREGHEQLDGEDAKNLPDETLPNLLLHKGGVPALFLRLSVPHLRVVRVL